MRCARRRLPAGRSASSAGYGVGSMPTSIASVKLPGALAACASCSVSAGHRASRFRVSRSRISGRAAPDCHTSSPLASWPSSVAASPSPCCCELWRGAASSVIGPVHRDWIIKQSVATRRRDKARRGSLCPASLPSPLALPSPLTPPSPESAPAHGFQSSGARVGVRQAMSQPVWVGHCGSLGQRSSHNCPVIGTVLPSSRVLPPFQRARARLSRRTSPPPSASPISTASGAASSRALPKGAGRLMATPLRSLESARLAPSSGSIMRAW